MVVLLALPPHRAKLAIPIFALLIALLVLGQHSVPVHQDPKSELALCSHNLPTEVYLALPQATLKVPIAISVIARKPMMG